MYHSYIIIIPYSYHNYHNHIRYLTNFMLHNHLQLEFLHWKWIKRRGQATSNQWAATSTWSAQGVGWPTTSHNHKSWDRITSCCRWDRQLDDLLRKRMTLMSPLVLVGGWTMLNHPYENMLVNQPSLNIGNMLQTTKQLYHLGFGVPLSTPDSRLFWTNPKVQCDSDAEP